MRTAPNNWENIIEHASSYHYETKVSIDGTEYGEDAIFSLTRTLAAMNTDQTPSVGGAIAGELELEMLNADGVFDVARRANVIPYIRLIDDDDAENVSGWLKMGSYYVDTRQIDHQSGNIIFSCFDAMMKAEQIYIQSNLVDYGEILSITGVDASWADNILTINSPLITQSWKDGVLTLNFDTDVTETRTADIVVTNIAALMGVTVEERTLADLENYGIVVPFYPGQYTCREVLQFIAVAHGGNFFIDDEGRLRMIFLDNLPPEDAANGGFTSLWVTGTKFDGGTMDPWNDGLNLYGGIFTPWYPDESVPDNIDLGHSAQTFTRDTVIPPYGQVILVQSDENQIVSGDGDTYLEAECPFATQLMADMLLLRLSNYEYVPFEAINALLTPLFEFGDEVTLDSVVVKPYAMDQRFNQLMPCDIRAESTREINHEFEYESPTERKIQRLAENTTATFEVLGDRIESKVSQTDFNGQTIASKINQSAESVTIEAQHINLNGAVTANGNFHINEDGSFEANHGTIGYLDVEDGVLTATYIRDYTYTQEDLTRIQEIIMGSEPVGDELEKYDLNGDGRVTTLDYVRLKKAVDDYEGQVTMTVTIDAQDFGAVIKVGTDTSGDTMRIGALAIHVPYLYAERAFISGNSEIDGSLSVTGNVSAAAFVNSSKAEKKKDITPYKGALERLEGTDIFSFRYRTEDDQAKLHTGAVIGEGYSCCDDIISSDGEGIDTYAMTSVLWQAVKELKAEIEELKGGTNGNTV